MTDPNPVRRLFADSPSPAIDVNAVVRRCRARRAPRLLAVGVAGALAAGGVLTVSVQALGGLAPHSAADSAGAESAESASTLDEPERSTNQAATDTPLALTTATTAPGVLALTLTNTGAETLRGTTAGQVSVTDQDGQVQVVEVAATDFVLASGESVTVDVAYPPEPATASGSPRAASVALGVTLAGDAAPVIVEG